MVAAAAPATPRYSARSAPVAAVPKPTTTPAVADPVYTRLHITPFDADLFAIVVPAAVRPVARNVSFHGLQTFPEKRYGFVDLPADAAERLRNKLNGAVLKGVKLRIEPARQPAEEKEAMARDKELREKEPKEPKEIKDATGARDERATTKRSKKTKLGHDELAGVQLEPGRQVRRGWTEPADNGSGSGSGGGSRGSKKKRSGEDAKADKKTKKAERSAYTDGPECLFKTVLPANKVAKPSTGFLVQEDRGPASPAEAASPVDERALKRARRQEKKAREVVVHEFANWTRIPTFLKAAGGASASSANL